MIAFIEDHRGEFGVEPICRVLPIAPSTYYAYAAIVRDPDLASDRAKQDAKDLEDIKRVYDNSKGRYGARKVWHQLRREGKDIARCQTGGLPGEFNLSRVERSDFRLPVFVIYTSIKGVLRRPVESAQYLAVRYTERLAQAGIDASVGSVGDSYDNALAESVIGLFKTEVINFFGTWKTIRQVEWETLNWVNWYNTERLHARSATSRRKNWRRNSMQT